MLKNKFISRKRAVLVGLIQSMVQFFLLGSTLFGCLVGLVENKYIAGSWIYLVVESNFLFNYLSLVPIVEQT